MPRLIFFTGHAGTGKTTLCKRAVQLLHQRTAESFVLLDKDTVYGTYSARVMGLLTGDPNDRDSATFLDNLREPEYSGMLEIARENLALGVNVILCAPFSREVRSRAIFDRQRLGLMDDVDLHVVWVSIGEAVARRRIIERGDARDAYKLAHWEQYRLRRFEPDPAEYPQLIVFDNSTPIDARFDALIERLVGGRRRRPPSGPAVRPRRSVR